ncbi:hypothetical protein [Streptomyces sp. NPDC048191]|uniref:hypothetical protein n=1 Tax=Streptomyces sp. NPDC048191 TaxID=3155484 RepID=UPI0033E3059B
MPEPATHASRGSRPTTGRTPSMGSGAAPASGTDSGRPTESSADAGHRQITLGETTEVSRA